MQNNESARIRLRELHQHDLHDVPPGGGGGAGSGEQRPDGSEPSAGRRAGRLRRADGKVYYTDRGGGDPVAVRVVWALPLSGRGGPVSVLQAGKKREIAYLRSLEELSPESRAVAEEELAAGMVMPVITEIRSVRQRFGNYYWDVETDRGPAKFLLASPETNSLRPLPDTVVIRDVSGNCYEIASVAGLDRNSRSALDSVL